MHALAGLVFPRTCVACGASGLSLCPACEAALPRAPHACARCAMPSPSPADHCGACRAHAPAFSAARAAVLYRGAARDAVMAFKLGGERRAAPALAVLMAPIVVALAPDVLTFVPSTARTTRARGCNPARELARAVARATGVRCAVLLRKVRETADQAGLGAAERRRNQDGAYRARAVRAARVGLIDDVITTGATADACARALRDAGARDVVAIAFARTP